MSRPTTATADAARVPSAPRPLPRWLSLVAVAGTVLAIGLRVVAALAAGPLWRDEAGSASTATVPTFAAFLERQHFDSFPLLWQLLLRVWTTVVWDDTDAAIRTLGLLVALLLVPALWWTCRSLRVVPLASLLFAGVAPLFVVWAGIQNRAYGLGVVLLALLIGAVWRLTEAPTARRIALAAALAVLAVHTTYQNPPMVAALLGAAALVGLRRRAWRVVVAAAGVGLVAALSLLVYAGVLERTRVLAKMVYAGVSLTSIVTGIGDALAPGDGFVVVPAFVILTLAACAWGWIVALRAPSPPLDDDARDAVTFAVAAATLGLLGQALFLLYLRFLVQPWYYATVVLVVAVAIDVVVQRGLVPAARDVVAGAIAVLLVASLVPAYRAVDRRQSNIDLVAAYLEANARPDDLIVVYPWHHGLSFARYYDGAVPWMTMPAVEGHDYHRFDQLERLMRDPELTRPGFKRIYQTLASGNGVWVVGSPATDVPPAFPALPPARDDDPASWRDGVYTAMSGLQLSWIIQKATPRAYPVPALTEARVSDYENPPITLYSFAPR